MVVQHNTDDIVQDGLILRHELAYILNVMRIRLGEGQFRKTQPHPVSRKALIRRLTSANRR